MTPDDNDSTSKGFRELEEVVDSDKQQLELRCSFGVIESFASGFASLNFVGGIRSVNGNLTSRSFVAQITPT
ncbi:hypothetical protein FRC03_003021 [Tulasnella sp. 419]|nr:hypothetical protein FRC03_003021 [Tulasnella sp. 419]